MAITIKETFQVQAPVEAVWKFVMDPHQVATCMPGAQLDEVVDERTFLGTIKIKVGAITTSYKGRIQLTKVDEPGRVIEMAAEGREAGGGTAKGTMTSRLQTLPDGQTEMVAEANVDITGRIMQVGRGMIQAVSHQLFLQFVAAVKARLEVPGGSAAATAADPTSGGNPGTLAAAAPAPEPVPIRVLPLLMKTLWAVIQNFFRRLFAGGGGA